MKSASKAAIGRLEESQQAQNQRRNIFLLFRLRETVTAMQFFYLYLLPRVARFVILIKVVLNSSQDESPEWRWPPGQYRC
jgi:hypothetical protein